MNTTSLDNEIINYFFQNNIKELGDEEISEKSKNNIEKILSKYEINELDKYIKIGKDEEYSHNEDCTDEVNNNYGTNPLTLYILEQILNGKNKEEFINNLSKQAKRKILYQKYLKKVFNNEELNITGKDRFDYIYINGEVESATTLFAKKANIRSTTFGSAEINIELDKYEDIVMLRKRILEIYHKTISFNQL
jgi:hypothetical protein